jgi:putative membrane protein
VRKITTASLILFLFAASMSGHEGEAHDTAGFFNNWSFDPLIVVSLILLAAIYLTGLLRLWRTRGFGRAISGWESMAFLGAWVSLVIALVSPLHRWGEVLFSAHMTQHEVLMLVSAPLLVLSRPLIASLWSMPLRWRQAAGSVMKTGPLESAWRFATEPLSAFLIHAVALWVWHIPYLFQATLKSDVVHTFQHFSFFGSALLFWWAIIAGQRGVASYGAAILYLFATSIHSGILGALLTFSKAVLYPAYTETQSWGLTAIEDQQLGGLIMWAPAGLIYLGAGLIMFASWLHDSDKRVKARERQMWVNAE